MLTRTATRISSLVFMLIAVLAMLMAGATSSTVAAPQGTTNWSLRAQNVDWMTPDQAATLDLAFPVLVPSWIPAPFGGSPAIDGGGGYYSLYWVNYGGPPTFLQITGEVGGSLPAGSPADLNVELSVNASVQGYDAIHDVTGIYDNVWWIAGNVLYRVSSNNMTGTDSLSLANSLIAFEAPTVEEPTPTEPPVDESSSTEINNDPNNGQSLEEVDDDTTTDSEPTADSTQEPTQEPDAGTGGNAEPTLEAEAETAETTAPATPSPDTNQGSSAGIANSPGSASTGALSDGTAGPMLPISGDGTGGIFQVAIP